MANPDFNTILADALAKQKVTANADRIRAMTDKELAKELCALLWCEICPVAGRCKDGVDAWLEWLQSPAGGDGDG